ncbi:MAG TPA: CvpA family protein [Verrucomicrobiota bacterium]|nr:CvpA family protein [Verrucomicrobiota bacterium]HNU50362.1 CvpA family protein [Verrucomicrobiota bacterium]
MVIWLILLAIFAILGVTGYYKGAIRSAVSLVGLGFAVFLALPLSPPLRPLVAKVGLTHPAWEWILPPVVVFFLVVLVFLGLSFLVHYKASRHFYFATDEYTRIKWERLNHRLGLCIGFVAAGVYAILVGLIIYVFGYPAVQVVGDDSPLAQRMLATARKEMQGAGLDRTLASIDPMHDTYYLASDLIGLIYLNPILQDRLVNYPAFLELSERQEIRDVIGDTEVLNAWQTRAPVMTLVNHPKIVGLIQNAEISGEIKRVDLKDLYQYLTTGKSTKYDEERILGRWRIDAGATLTLTRKKNPEMSAAEMNQVRTLVTVFLNKVTFMATPDNKAFIRFELSDEAKRLVEAARAAVEAARRQAEESGMAPAPTMDPRMMQRYGLRGRQPNQPQGEDAATPAPTAPVKLPGIPDIKVAGQGSWEREGTKYKFKISQEQGPAQAGEGTITEDRLTMTLGGQPLVFIR